MLQLIAHLVGDYILQNDWMALNKSKSTMACAIHCGLYSFPFMALAVVGWLPVSGAALLVIIATHFLIDRFGLARYLVWFKNRLLPGGERLPWAWCSKTGWFDPELALAVVGRLACSDPKAAAEPYDFINRLVNDGFSKRPFWLQLFLLIVVDNTLHLACNWAAIMWL